MTKTASPPPRPAAARRIIEATTGAIAATTGPALVGLYLYGSLATGDFDKRISDIDLLAVLSAEVSAALAARLERMHDELGEDNPAWRGRIDVVYVSAVGLANFRRASPRLAVISPGEPFHVTSGGTDWILTWYPARHDGVVLVGLPVSELVPDISLEEYLDAVRKHMRHFTQRIADDATPGLQAYAVLTMCRGLYTCEHGERVSKLSAAKWAQREFPEWAGLIREAITWRKAQWKVPQADGTATLPAVRRFVAEIADIAARGRGR